MRRAIILLYLVSANSEMTNRGIRSRKARSNPVHTGYYYRRSIPEPSVVSVFDSNDQSTPLPRSIKNKNTEVSTECDFNHVKDASNVLDHENYMGYEKAKSKCNRNANSDRLKLGATAWYEVNKRYNRNSDYGTDENDVRTDNNMYDGWPYSYRNRYDYNFNFDPESDKAKDKRYVNDVIERVIPVHEDNEEIHRSDISSSEKEREYEDINPMYGNQAFFSHVLEDYFDRTKEEDPLIFKGLYYNKDFDRIPNDNNQDINRRLRRLKTYDSHATPYNYNKIREKHNMEENLVGTGDEYNKIRHEDDKSKKEFFNEGDKTRYNYGKDNYIGFKNFMDSFINKFGSEDHSKDTDFKVNRTLDKGEKKKGFRRVYHKDEYQEDNEFYDNSHNKSVLTENGGSKFKVGGSEAQLASNAVAHVGNEESSINKIGNKDSAKFEDKNLESRNSKGDIGLQRFKQIAKNAAQQNNIDYYNL